MLSTVWYISSSLRNVSRRVRTSPRKLKSTRTHLPSSRFCSSKTNFRFSLEVSGHTSRVALRRYCLKVQQSDLPQGPQGDGAQSRAESDACLAVVEHDSRREAVARRLAWSLAESAEVLRVTVAAALTSTPARCPVLRSSTTSTSAPSLSRKWWKRIPSSCPARLSAQLLEHEGLEELAEQLAVGPEGVLVHAQEGRGDPGVTHVELRRLDEATQPVAVPRRESAPAGRPARAGSRSRESSDG